MPSSATRAVRPASSEAAITWFRLGDRDLATHLYRTARRAEGATLTEITAEIAAAWNVGVVVLPMTDGEVSTHLILADGSELAFQDYFVRLHHDVEVERRAHRRRPEHVRRPQSWRRSTDADIVVIAPSNPLVSIQPLRALPGIDDALARRRDTVVAVSPIVGGKALKGPADRLLRELGHEPTVAGVARLYAPIAAALVIDPGRRRTGRCRRGGRHARRDRPIGDVDTGGRRRARPGDARRHKG